MTAEIALLAIIAVVVTAMAVAQVVSLRHVMKMAGRASNAIEELQRDLAPVLKNAREATDTAARVAALAEHQMLRVDAMVRTTTTRVDDIVSVAHDVVTGPVRHGAAIVAGLRAAWEVFTAERPARHASGHGDHEAHDEADESGMFVG